MKKTQNYITELCENYPGLQLYDIFKFIHQSAFGCEHLVSSYDNAIRYITEEKATARPNNMPLVEQLDGNYSRVNLNYLDLGLSAETLGKLFFMSATAEENGKAKLSEKISAVKELAHKKILPFSAEKVDEELKIWESNNFGAVHHSESFRAEYNPSYRVVSNKFVPFLPLFAELDKKLCNGKVVLAIDGACASGKTTLSKILEEIYDCSVFHADDFFLRPEQRTTERYSEIGGNLDRERFENEILTSLNKNKVNYRKFNCSIQSLSDIISVDLKKLVVIEGVYSMRPEFEKYYDLTVFLDISSDLQRERIKKRNSPEFCKMFFEKWIPLENVYFEKMNVSERCDLKLSIF